MVYIKKIIIDLREPREYYLFHLENSINIPYDKLMNNYKELLNKEDMYIFYCKSGILSKKASVFLKTNGYNTNIIR